MLCNTRAVDEAILCKRNYVYLGTRVFQLTLLYEGHKDGGDRRSNENSHTWNASVEWGTQFVVRRIVEESDHVRK